MADVLESAPPPPPSSPEEARARAKAEKAYRKALRPWYRKKRFILPLGLVTLILFASLSNDESAPGDFDAATQAVVDETRDRQGEEAQAEADAAAAEAEAEAQAAAEEAEAQAAAEEAEAEAEAAAEKKPDPEPQLTSGQENALRTAEEYLDYSAFSRKGLINQLEFEGYSTKDATFAADNVTVDWKEQAARSAAEYLDYSGFSRKGLIEQLEFEGYTREQATYGVDQAM